MTIRSIKFVRGAVGAAAVLALAAGPASATHLGPLDSDATACRAAISKSYGKLISTTGKTLASCHKLRDKGKNTVADCNDLSDLTNVDPKGKIAKAAAKINDAMAKSCVGQTELLASEYYMSCPEPCGTTLGLANPMTSFAQLNSCLGCAGPRLVADLYADAMGVPATLPLSTDDGKCHGAIAKGYQKYLDALVKGRQSCQGTEDKALNNTLTPCETSDPKAKGATALGKAGEGIDKSCAAANLANLDSCSAVDATALKSCLGSAFGDAADTGFTTGYELPATICPTTVQTSIRAGCSTDEGLTAGVCSKGGQTNTTLSVGWTGTGHGIDLPDHYSISADVTCPGPGAGSCGSCTIDGVSTVDPQYADFSRCKADPTIPCSPPFANNPACPSGGTCSYFLGAPLAFSGGGAFTCSLNTLFTDISGTADPDAGSSLLNLELRTIVHTGEGQTQPCPLCVDDTTPQDGIKTGHCVGGAKDVATNPGWTCDVQAFDLTYSGTDPSHSGPSLDCPPAQPANISGTGLAISLPLTTGSTSLAFQNACDAPNGAYMCACGQCSGNVALGCRNDQDCIDAGAGTCTTNGGGQAALRKPNACSGFTCDDAGALDRGECGIDTNLDQFCDGFLRASGRGVLDCLDDDTCRSLDTACPGGNCGNCTHLQLRSCFMDPIQTSGTPDTENPVLAGLFCLPPTANVSINETVGNPGAGLVKVDSLVHLGY
ncbi:MAG: hypothetical protein HY899_16680 [Deltaproteobacteria bacterium]|nr:hypothetical protein [Deltaproteobacteria bacterium]